MLVLALLRQRTGKAFQKKVLVTAILLLLAAVISNMTFNLVFRPQSSPEDFIVLSKRAQATFDILFALAIGVFLVVTSRPHINSGRDFRRYMVDEFPNSFVVYAFVMGLGLFSVATVEASAVLQGGAFLIQFPAWFLAIMTVIAGTVALYIPYNLMGYIRRVGPPSRVVRDTYLILLGLEGYTITEYFTEIATPFLGVDIRTFGFLVNVLFLALVAFAVRERGFLQELLVPVPEADLDTARSFHVEAGVSYVIPESTPLYSMEVFKDQVTHGVRGLCITRQSPAKVAESHGLEKTPILWLSRVVSDSNCVRPTPPENVAMAVDHFLEISEGSVVLLDGVEYLISHNDFPSILTLLHDLNERIALADAVLLLPVDPDAFDEREFSLLKRDLRLLEPGSGSRPREGLATEAYGP